MIIFDYNKLKGKIKEVCSTQENYAKALNRTDTTINNKLNNKSCFTQEEILKSIEVLNIEPNKVFEYFFKEKVENNSNN